jgi:hypothetical protein
MELKWNNGLTIEMNTVNLRNFAIEYLSPFVRMKFKRDKLYFRSLKVSEKKTHVLSRIHKAMMCSENIVLS